MSKARDENSTAWIDLSTLDNMDKRAVGRLQDILAVLPDGCSLNIDLRDDPIESNSPETENAVLGDLQEELPKQQQADADEDSQHDIPDDSSAGSDGTPVTQQATQKKSKLRLAFAQAWEIAKGVGIRVSAEYAKYMSGL